MSFKLTVQDSMLDQITLVPNDISELNRKLAHMRGLITPTVLRRCTEGAYIRRWGGNDASCHNMLDSLLSPPCEEEDSFSGYIETLQTELSITEVKKILGDSFYGSETIQILESDTGKNSLDTYHSEVETFLNLVEKDSLTEVEKSANVKFPEVIYLHSKTQLSRDVKTKLKLVNGVGLWVRDNPTYPNDVMTPRLANANSEVVLSLSDLGVYNRVAPFKGIVAPAMVRLFAAGVYRTRWLSDTLPLTERLQLELGGKNTTIISGMSVRYQRQEVCNFLNEHYCPEEYAVYKDNEAVLEYFEKASKLAHIIGCESLDEFEEWCKVKLPTVVHVTSNNKPLFPKSYSHYVHVQCVQ